MILLIDANNLIHRAYHALQATDVGEHTHAVIGFVNMLLAAIDDYKPDRIHIAFDTWPPTTNQRLAISSSYKSTRNRDAETYIQIKKVEELLRLAHFSYYQAIGYEADDIINSLAKRFAGQSMIILTNDGDMLQLATQTTAVTKISGAFAQRKLMYEGDVYRATGLLPRQIPDYKALAGDKSDNIDGVDGIGEVFAKRLLLRYNDLAGIYSALESGADFKAVNVPAKKAELLRQHWSDALLSLKLATLYDINLPLYDGKYKTADLHQAMAKLGIRRD